MALSLKERIATALLELAKTEERIDAQVAKSEAKAEEKELPFEAARQVNVSAHSDMTEILFKTAERSLRRSQQRLAAVKWGATADKLAIESRSIQLGYRLIDHDEQHPELTKLLAPYVSRALHAASVDFSLVKSMNDHTALQLSEEGEEGVPGRMTATDQQSLEASPDNHDPENFLLAGARAFAHIPWCSTIVLDVDDKWIKIRCPACDGNTSPSTGELMCGIKGMHDHMTLSHEYEHMSATRMIALCKVREVRFSTVRNICQRKKSGMPYIKMVKVRTETTTTTADRGPKQPISSTKDKSSEPSKVPWAWGLQPDNIIESIPCIVKHPNGKWFLLECPVCHGNASSRGNRGFLSGPKAFHDHLLKCHGEPSSTAGLAGTIERCQVRQLIRREVDDLKRGSPNAITIHPVQVRSDPRTVSEAHPPTTPLTEAEAVARDHAGVRELFAREMKRKASSEVNSASGSSRRDSRLGAAESVSRVGIGEQSAVRESKRRRGDMADPALSVHEEEDGGVLLPTQAAKRVFVMPEATVQKARSRRGAFIEVDSDDNEA
ncbi:hypothetical protein B0A55_06229 [Friedmanniomyces simplex]|uniref:Uncharacterized protein n=1 Tax=Friedmanniomyces simplex TaxID=329884 RepID=A0A4U0X6B1_9PEZI|nr:hypothetical protein B0A55_06229 [Friedmanniomyces simplex]